MAKRRGRKPKVTNNDTTIEEETMVENNENEFLDQEVVCQVDAIRALRVVEIEQLMVMLRVLRSYFSKEEQDKVRVLDLFREKLPNLSIIKNEENGQFVVQWKDENSSLFGYQAGGGNIDAPLLHGFSMLHRDFPIVNPSVGGSEFSNKRGFFGVETDQIPSFNLEEPSGSKNIEMQDKFQTPNVNNQRLSIGMTPKTLRLPKPGEILISVHGSPLGVYKEEDTMEAINEVEDA